MLFIDRARRLRLADGVARAHECCRRAGSAALGRAGRFPLLCGRACARDPAGGLPRTTMRRRATSRQADPPTRRRRAARSSVRANTGAQQLNHSTFL